MHVQNSVFSIGLWVGVWMCVCLVAFYGFFIFLICFSLCVCLSCYSFNCVCGCPWGEIKISIMIQWYWNSWLIVTVFDTNLCWLMVHRNVREKMFQHRVHVLLELKRVVRTSKIRVGIWHRLRQSVLSLMPGSEVWHRICLILKLVCQVSKIAALSCILSILIVLSFSFIYFFCFSFFLVSFFSHFTFFVLVVVFLCLRQHSAARGIMFSECSCVRASVRACVRGLWAQISPEWLKISTRGKWC